MAKLPTELASEVLIALISGGKTSTDPQDLARDFGIIFHKIFECRLVEGKKLAEGEQLLG
jgi:hypothetical protein